MKNIKILIIKLLVYTSIISCVYAKDLTRTDIEQFAKDYVYNTIALPENVKQEISVAKIDPRIIIDPCNSDLQAQLPAEHNSRNITLKILCPDPTPWNMYLAIKIKKTKPVLVANEMISKGSVLDSSNTTITYIEEQKIRLEVVSEIKKIAGAKAKRNISKGSPISKRNICLVCKGESVTIIAKSDSFMIKTSGIALKNGSIGQQIKVKNKDSGRTVSATVTAINKVVIYL